MVWWVDSISIAVLGGTVGATTATLFNKPVKTFAFNVCLLSGMYGSTFFLVRETFISYQRQKNSYFGLKNSVTKDHDAMLSSTLAGTMTGGLVNGIFKGPRAALPSAVVMGALCSGLQFVYTKVNHWRQEAIIKSGSLDGEDVYPNEDDQPKKSFLQHIHLPSWFPIREISEEDYKELLDTKLHTLEAELAELQKKLDQQEKATKELK
ncbi:hypothetical protein BDF20DRAFT_600397 [Mycotypha africana]|uniref:uncharacterized protein n=1 Tax=Mycotypha africana TaxID=64632 RepID=UPI00230198CB|nr:uncharacterized protein BDF20DRAFT_600397 [Mycotypha africana]KAI8975342.1 hypothetical protein BDF20DRAFT_600397 [Mycotypha africana]